MKGQGQSAESEECGAKNERQNASAELQIVTRGLQTVASGAKFHEQAPWSGGECLKSAILALPPDCP